MFVHAGRVFAAAENDNPHEMDLDSLDTMGSWSIGGDLFNKIYHLPQTLENVLQIFNSNRYEYRIPC